MLKEIPMPVKKINGFLINELNKFINEQRDAVLRFYTRLVDVDVDSLV